MEDPSEEWSCMAEVTKINTPEEDEIVVEDVEKIVEQQPSVQSGQSKNGGTSSKSKSGQNRNRNKKDKSDDKGDSGQKQVSFIDIFYHYLYIFLLSLFFASFKGFFVFATPILFCFGVSIASNFRINISLLRQLDLRSSISSVHICNRSFCGYRQGSSTFNI